MEKKYCTPFDASSLHCTCAIFSHGLCLHTKDATSRPHLVTRPKRNGILSPGKKRLLTILQLHVYGAFKTNVQRSFLREWRECVCGEGGVKYFRKSRGQILRVEAAAKNQKVQDFQGIYKKKCPWIIIILDDSLDACKGQDVRRSRSNDIIQYVYGHVSLPTVDAPPRIDHVFGRTCIFVTTVWGKRCDCWNTTTNVRVHDFVLLLTFSRRHFPECYLAQKKQTNKLGATHTRQATVASRSPTAVVQPRSQGKVVASLYDIKVHNFVLFLTFPRRESNQHYLSAMSANKHTMRTFHTSQTIVVSHFPTTIIVQPRSQGKVETALYNDKEHNFAIFLTFQEGILISITWAQSHQNIQCALFIPLWQ